MSQELLNKAAHHFALGAIYLKRSEVFVDDSFSIYEEDKDIKQQSLRGIRSYKLVSQKRDDKEFFLYKYVFSVGVRLIDNKLEEGDEGFVLVKIEADFEANYLSDEELEERCAEAFGELDVTYHVWPYWREYVQNTCCRMGINPIMIPLYTDLQKAKEESEESEKG